MRKKLLFSSLLALLLVATSLSLAFAQEDMADPALCVAGQWLTVNAATEQAIVVAVPPGTAYGDKGHCAPPAPAQTMISHVTVLPIGSNMVVTVAGKQASKPTVVASYNGKTFTEKNNGGPIIFRFNLPKK
jgi:hypothetical protein